jgi:hypothetical protein
MSFNIKYLPNISELRLEYETLGHEKFVEHIKKYESIVGPIESQKFINKIITKKTK